MHTSFGRSVAVIGSGVAGLTAAYALSGRDRVTLYEADSRLGGHAHTHLVRSGDGTAIVAEPLSYRPMTRPRHHSDLDALLRQVAGGDADAFAALYDHTRARVYGLVTRVLRDSGYSEETTQEVYLEVWRTARAYDSAKGSALSWLLTMAHRRAVDRVRAEQSASQRDSKYGAASVERPGDLVADSAIAADERRRVAACLDGLTDMQRQCIDLAYYGGLTYVEVSQRLSANLSTIKSRMRDALRGLRNCLGAT